MTHVPHHSLGPRTNHPLGSCEFDGAVHGQTPEQFGWRIHGERKSAVIDDTTDTSTAGASVLVEATDPAAGSWRAVSEAAEGIPARSHYDRTAEE